MFLQHGRCKGDVTFSNCDFYAMFLNVEMGGRVELDFVTCTTCEFH